jgi:hypothetical protein
VEQVKGQNSRRNNQGTAIGPSDDFMELENPEATQASMMQAFQ